MKVATIALASIAALVLTSSFAYAMKHLPEERGKALFNDSKLAGATSGMSCNSCHPNGKGLEQAAHKQEFKRRGSFFLFTTATYSVLFAIAGVASIYAYDARLNEQSLELVTMVPIEAVAPEQHAVV